MDWKKFEESPSSRARARECYDAIELLAVAVDVEVHDRDAFYVHRVRDAPQLCLTHDVLAEGHVRIYRTAGTFIGERAIYNTETKEIHAVEIKTDNVQTMRLYFNDRLVDLKKPVTIIVNKKPRFEGLLKPSITEMLNDQLFLGRGWRYYTAVIDVDLLPTTQPATRPATRKGTISVAPSGE